VNATTKRATAARFRPPKIRRRSQRLTMRLALALVSDRGWPQWLSEL
jgi:hypothetical protein